MVRVVWFMEVVIVGSPKVKGRGSCSYYWLVLVVLDLAEVENQTWVRLGRRRK